MKWYYYVIATIFFYDTVCKDNYLNKFYFNIFAIRTNTK